MRIGILTFHRSYNYGAYMQCFSLVKRIEKEFPEHSIEVIDYNSVKAFQRYDNEILKYPEEERDKVKQRNEQFIPCQEELPLSKKKIISDQMDEVVQYMNENYDIVIAGSDAIWNWNVRGFPNIWFLKDYNGIKMSYAASVHGMIYQNMTEEQKQYVKESLNDFRYIGVRDITTEEFVEYAAPGLTVHHNCDPTMFLNTEDVPCDIKQLKDKLQRCGVDFTKPLIGVMAENRTYAKMIKQKYGNKVQLVAVYEPNPYADIYINDLNPYEWAKVFSFFKVTVTHFFHGTMLSLVNNTPVIPIEFITAFSAKNTTKIKDLMTRMELTDWRREADYRKMNIIMKALKKYGFYVDRKLWNDVYAGIDDMLNNDYSNLICEKKEKERKSSDSFFDELRKIIKENGE